jgi:hypothetical protein
MCKRSALSPVQRLEMPGSGVGHVNYPGTLQVEAGVVLMP